MIFTLFQQFFKYYFKNQSQFSPSLERFTIPSEPMFLLYNNYSFIDKKNKNNFFVYDKNKTIL